MPQLKLGYWEIRGLAQSIRYLLNYVKADYVERTYTFGDSFTRDDWFKEKFTLGLDFPNIPYLFDGDMKLTQSLAILRYLGRKYNLMPESDDEWLRASIVEQQINDMLWENVRLCYDPSYDDEKKRAFLKTFHTDRLPALVKFLGDRKFFAGDKLSYVDFLAYEMFDQHRTLWPEERKELEKYPAIVQYLKRMESLPAFKAYLSSDKFKDWPVWSEMSTYGGPKMAKPVAKAAKAAK